jgi:hypothetical protein
MDLVHETVFPASVADTQELLLNEQFLTHYAQQTGAVRQDVTVDRGTDSPVSRVRRQMPTDQIPGVFRRMFGAAVEVTEVTTWEPTSTAQRTAVLAADIDGLPVRFRGASTLSATADGSRLRVTGSVKASVPLIGAKAEQLLADAITAALDKQAALAGDWPRGRRSGAR